MRERQTFLFFFFFFERRKGSREKKSLNNSSLLIFLANVCSKNYTLRFMRLIKKVTRASSSQNYQFLQKRRKKTSEIEKIFFLEIAIPIENFINEIHKVSENFTIQRREKISSSPEKLYPNIPKYWKHLTNPLALVQEGGMASSFEIVAAIVRLKKTPLPFVCPDGRNTRSI